MGEVGSKFDYVFGDRAVSARKALDEFGASVGRSKLDLYTMSSGIQALFRPMGFTNDQGAMMSVTLTKLATDVASFNNEVDTEVMEGFKSALIGNAEAVRKYGVIINETTLNAELMKMGVAGGTAAASEQQKVLARLNMILEGTKDASGDATRTADSFANMSKGLWAALSDLGVEIGNILIPALKVFMGMTKDGIAFIQENATALRGWGETFANWAKYVVDSVYAAIEVVSNFDLYWEMASLTVEEVVTGIADRVAWFADNAWAYIEWFFNNFWDIAQTTGQNYLQLWTNVGNNFGAIWKNLWRMIKTGGREGFNEIIGLMKQDMKEFATAPEFKKFEGTDFSKRWEEHGQKWSDRLQKMEKSAEETGEGIGESLDIGKMFDSLEGGGKAKEIKASISGLEEVFKRNLTGRFEEDAAKKTAQMAEATALGVEKLVQQNDTNHKELVDAVKGSSGVGP
jgi:hypothetical protein